MNGDGFDDVLVGDLNDDDGGDYAGAAYLVLGSTSPASRSLGAADAELTGEVGGDYAGNSVSTAGDLDGDGFDDMLVGAFGAGGTGAAYLLFGTGL